ncbi:oligoendopeptidase F [Roseburia hominis]|uniref:Oligopeptidase F n=1 Tax=Roseburia hominis TaxID=301301 RepID=A0A395VFC8_9FIRM|nr:oligoendopeptidase F [Roseburia hominis]RGS42192.1 oligoendopeptidase F [Roseburia hominis]
MARELPKRSEVKEEYTWDVSAMYASKAAWEADLKEVVTIVSDLAKLEGSVMASAEKLLTALELGARAEQKIDLAFNYAERLFDQDQKNTEHQAMSQKMYGVVTDYQSRTAFVVPEILAADKATLAQYFSEKKELELYRGLVDEILRTKEHVLSAEMEKLVAMTGEMAQTPEQVYSIINNADLIYPEIEDENGEKVRLSHGNFVPFEESGDRRVRKDAFEAFYSIYKQFAGTIAGLYNGQVKQQIFYAKARNYASTLEAAVDANNVPAKVYRNLVETVNANMDKMHRYVKLRKKCLGVDELHMYDVYTPMIADAAKKVSYDEAKETVLKALAPLGEDYVATVKEGFENRWIDVYENEGKRSGAYSAGAFGTHPYVLLNYNDTLDNMFTLAHEMGHAMHSWYSNANQPYIYSQYKIFVAEVASTCNEILLMEYLLANTTDKKERAYLLNHYLDSFKGTVYRQTMFAEFEMKSNQMAEAGESLNAENLCKLYYGLNQKYFGEDMVSDPQIAYEWARIPHFYYNFYVYQYATSFSAAVAIAHGILEEGAPAVERYKKFLSGGCSMSPVDLLKQVGINMEEPKPIQDALDVFGKVLDEIETLI